MSIFEDVATPAAPEATGGAGDGSAATSNDGEDPGRNKRRKTLIALIIIAILLLLVGAIFVWYLITRKPITTIPGLGTGKVPSYQYSLYNVSAPLGVAVNADGSRVYITQSGSPATTVLFDRSGHKLATLTPPKADGKMHAPLYVAVSPVTGRVYVSDRYTSAVYVYSAGGKFLRTLSHNGLKGGWVPLALGFDSAGNLYVTQALPHTSKILVLSEAGVLERTIKAPSPMSFPNGVAVDKRGDVAVTDSNNGRVLVFTPDGKVGWNILPGSAPGDLGLPRGIAFDTQGHFVVVDTTDHSARVYALKAAPVISYVATIGDEGVGNGLFQFPNGAAADGRAHVYITDRVNNRVQVWSY